jgi:hypothetical protein
MAVTLAWLWMWLKVSEFPTDETMSHALRSFHTDIQSWIGQLTHWSLLES